MFPLCQISIMNHKQKLMPYKLFLSRIPWLWKSQTVPQLCEHAPSSTTDKAVCISWQRPAYALAVGTIEWPQLDLRVTFLDDPCCWHTRWQSLIPSSSLKHLGLTEETWWARMFAWICSKWPDFIRSNARVTNITLWFHTNLVNQNLCPDPACPSVELTKGHSFRQTMSLSLSPHWKFEMSWKFSVEHDASMDVYISLRT